ncbi:BQ2448_1200 [Microbotryum intermedium]|uniref:BQ2448_1200 protein n=1 Tax=Microbotryum intermedium TaxID=269621 RepID=A0A238FFD6_9BASI|nr:BQ2448_1200 [Microbotryum intermedium]
MPPDRTASSSTPEKLLPARPLSTRGPKHTSLERGRACLVCRARKVKCDGIAPTCSPCRKSAGAKGDDPCSIVCDYDAEEKRKRPVGGGRVHALEAKISELEKQIVELTSNNPKLITTASVIPLASGIMPASLSPDSLDGTPVASTSRASISSANTILFDHAPEHLIDVSIYALDGELPPPIDPNVYFHRSHFVQRHVVPIPMPLITPSSQFVHPSWPKTLPSPTLVSRLVDVYFTKIHTSTGMINRGKFLASLQLPPSHTRFPITPLLHAIIATASTIVSEDYWAGEERYWSQFETPSDWHARVAKNTLDASWVSSANPLQVAQTAVLVCFLSYSAARFGDVWLAVSQALRLSVPLGLNHLRSAPSLPPENLYLKTHMLGPTEDEDELYERAATFWLAFTCDRFGGASTGWASVIDDNDITTLLPSHGTRYLVDGLNSSPLSIHNERFLMDNPPLLVDSLGLYLKAVWLLGRVSTWLQRSSIGLGLGNGPLANDLAFLHAPAGVTDPRDLPAFKALEQMIFDYQTHVPREYQQLYQHPNPDSRMYLVFSLPHAAVILLHEPFCTIRDDDVSMQKCSQSAKAILNSIFTLYSSSFDIGLLVPFTNFVWAVAGRTLVRELAIKIERKVDVPGQTRLRSEVTMILSAMRAYKSGLGVSTSTELEYLLANPSLCLPEKDLKHHALGFRAVTKMWTGAKKPSTAISVPVPGATLSELGPEHAVPTLQATTAFSGVVNPLEMGVEGQRFQEMLDSVDFDLLANFSNGV